MSEMNCVADGDKGYTSDLTIINIPINNNNYCYIFSILARISDCEEKIRKAGSRSEGYYVKFRYDDPDGMIVTIDNGHNHLRTFSMRIGDSMVARHVANTIFGRVRKHGDSLEVEYNVFVRMEGNINKDDFKCRLYFYNDERKFRINFRSATQAKIYSDVRKRALSNLEKMGENHLWLNEHLVGSYI